jgi:hypothetical protein
MSNLQSYNFSTIAELERENFQLYRLQEWAGQNFQSRLARILDKAAAQVEVKLKENGELTRHGNFKINAHNQAMAVNVASDLTRVLDEAGYTELVKEHLAYYGPLFAQAKNVWSGTGLPFEFDAGDIEQLQALADHDASYFGRLPALGVATIEKALTESVLVGADFQTATKAIQAALSYEQSEWARHAFTYANDSLMNFSAAMSAVRDQEHKPEFYYYAGTIIKTSRQFCRHRAGKVYHADMIHVWETWDWQGKKPGPIMVTRGGWNCKHSFIGVSNAWVEAMDLEVETGAGPMPTSPVRRKPPGLKGASFFKASERSLLRTWKGELKGSILDPVARTAKELKVVAAPEKKEAPKKKTRAKTGKETPLERYQNAQKGVKDFQKTWGKRIGGWDICRGAVPGSADEFVQGFKLHQELHEAHIAWYKTLDPIEKRKERLRLVKSMVKVNQKADKQYRDVLPLKARQATDYIPFRLLRDLERNGLVINFGSQNPNFRAKYVPSHTDPGKAQLSIYSSEKTIAHEVGHAIDSFLSSSCMGWRGKFGFWEDTERGLNVYVSPKDAEAYRNWFKSRWTYTGDTPEKGLYSSERRYRTYWKDNWLNDYEGRDYEDPGYMATEWWSMNTQRYGEYVRFYHQWSTEVANMEAVFAQAKKNRTNPKSLAPIEIRLKRLKREGPDEWAARESDWILVRKEYPELAKFMEALYQNPEDGW